MTSHYNTHGITMKLHIKPHRIYAIIPARNEKKNIGRVVQKVKSHIKDVIVVDDGSTDGTGKKAEGSGAFVLRHIINLGKGAALKTGCDYAIEHGADILIVLDADGQHDPAEIPLFLKALKGNDIVIGARKFNQSMPKILLVGNWLINRVTEMLYNVRIKDSLCGYRAFTKYAYLKIRWNVSDYSMESEMVANVGRHKLKYKQVEIATIYSDKYKGTTVFDGFKIVLDLLYWKLRGNGFAK